MLPVSSFVAVLLHICLFLVCNHGFLSESRPMRSSCLRDHEHHGMVIFLRPNLIFVPQSSNSCGINAIGNIVLRDM